MKPVKLVIEGINSFIEAQTLDFEAAGRSNLFCICGKTGAGKTTVFDSIMLALYGKSTKGNLADVVNLSLMSARVCLDFVENGQSYTVERTIKCRFDKDDNGVKTDKRVAVSDCVLYKNGAPFAKGEEANDIISGIIGLEAAEFKNVYLLEQGEYAEFLKKTPAKQTEAVGKIFSLMRFGDIHKTASDRARELFAEIAGTEREISGLGEVTPRLLREHKDELKALRAKHTALIKECETHVAVIAELEKTRDVYISARSKQDNVKNLMLQADDAKKRESAAKAKLRDFESALDPADEQKLKQLREQLNRLSALNMIDKEYAAAVAELNMRAAAISDKKAAVDTAERSLRETTRAKQADEQKLRDELNAFLALARDASPRSSTLDGVIAALSGESAVDRIADSQYKLMDERKAYAELCKRRDRLKNELNGAVADCEKRLKMIERCAEESANAEARHKEAEDGVSSARAALGEAQLGSHAAAVRAELHDGDVCPVCGATYGGGHTFATDHSDVEKCKAELENAEVELKSAAAQAAERARLNERAKTDYDNAVQKRRNTENDIAELDREMGAVCVVPERYDMMINALSGCKAAAEKARQSAERMLKQEPQAAVLKTELAGLTESAAELKSKTEAFSAELGENCGRTDGKIAEIKAVTAELEKKLTETDNMRKELTAAVHAAAATVEAIERSLSAARADCPVDVPEFDEQAYNDRREQCDRLKKQMAENERDMAVKEVTITSMTEKCDRLTQLRSEIEQLKKRADMYDKIAEITRGKAMLNYVAAEYIAEFTAIAGDILSELSSGKYTMSYDKVNGFVVYDYLNEGKPRKTDTLSGGEMFLASLSVAIAIARTQSRGNNAFFFLDEGFGTLDEDLIDVVYGALEALSKDCLVGVITHAEALISRMPFTVTISEATDTHGSMIN